MFQTSPDMFKTCQHMLVHIQQVYDMFYTLTHNCQLTAYRVNEWLSESVCEALARELAK